MHRRLADILTAMVVRYLCLLGEEETGTLAAQRVDSEELIGPKLAAHEERMIMLVGAGFLVNFPSAVEPRP
jgi:hypothetical protein